jgi:CheY-specific phosphatase CheX
MRTEFITPFLQAATEVLEAELGTAPRRGTLGLEKSVNTSNDITAVVGVTGMVLYVMNEATGCGMV